MFRAVANAQEIQFDFAIVFLFHIGPFRFKELFVGLVKGIQKCFAAKVNAHIRTFVTFLITMASGVILLSGMVHTEYTVAPVQFISYGALIVAMILKTVLWQKKNGIASLRWLTLSYIVAFSMAIPVCYRATSIEHMSLFYIAECATSFLLVGGFTYLLYLVMTDAPTEKMLTPIIPAVSLVGNTLAIALWWREKINAFVLIFLVISTILWLVTAVISAKRKKS